MDQAHGDGAPLEPRLIAAVTPPPPGARFAQLDAFAHASPVKPRSLIEARTPRQSRRLRRSRGDIGESAIGIGANGDLFFRAPALLRN